MVTPSVLRGFRVILFGAIVLAGCGGGGSSATGASGSTATSGTPPANAPTAKTIADSTANLGVNAEALLCTSFSDFRRTLVGPGAHYFDVPLGLYVSDLVIPTGVRHSYFVDSAQTEPAGTFNLAANDGAESESGPFSITAGRFAGLTGTYFDAVQSGGIEGSINFTFLDGSTQVSQFVENTSGETASLTATIGIAEPTGYTQNQKVTYNSDGSISATSKDSNGCQSTLSFASDLSGTGTLSGSDPGLPATVTWNTQGNGVVKYADTSVRILSGWSLG